jgi:hypothetical protein
MLIADLTNDEAVAGTAVAQIETAYETLRSGGREQGAAVLQAQLTTARAVRDRLKGDEGAGWREALTPGPSPNRRGSHSGGTTPFLKMKSP